MHIIVPVNVNQDDHLAIQDPERHQTAFAVAFPRVLAGDGEVVPNGFGPSKSSPCALMFLRRLASSQEVMP